MTDDLYERYKEALRVGHVAVLRGALEEALQAYKTAAAIAPSRALPHTSLGGVLLRLGHLEEALVEYAAAVARAPHDEGALLGQAEALTIAGQRVDAAQALDHVAEIQEAAGRLPEAADTLRRAMELEDGTDRARHQRGLLREIRLSAGDQAAEQQLARALRLRDEPSSAVIDGARSAVRASVAGGDNAAPAGVPEVSEAAEPQDGEAEPEVAFVPAVTVVTPVPAVTPRKRLDEPAWPANDVLASSGRAGIHAMPPAEDTKSVVAVATLDTVPAERRIQPGSADALTSASGPGMPASLEPMRAAVGVTDTAFDADLPLGPVGESQQQPTGDELLVAAEAADLAGDNTNLRSLLLWTARAYAREGRFDAGLDATHRLLQKAPGDVDAHLVLVELYVARDWNNLAVEKLALLGRLAELNNDEATRQRLCKVATRVFPKDERLGALCA
jgi:tetratricopeptide (TPR) repeat protein